MDGSLTNTGKGQKPRLKRGLASRMAGSVEAYGPESNIAWLDGAVERGEVTAALREAMVGVEEAMGRLAKAMAACQPRGAAGALSIRWWNLEGAHTVVRTPVLVRLERVGRALLPKRVVTGRLLKVRSDGAFAVNASLVPGLVNCYADLYVEWRELRELVKRTMTYRRVERRVCGRGVGVVKAAGNLADASMRAGRGRAEAAGYDMGWLDQLG